MYEKGIDTCNKSIDADYIPNVDIMNILKLISTVSKDSDKNQIITSICVYIYHNKRFRYSKIAEYIYSIADSKDEQVMFYMEQNIEDIVLYVKENKEKIIPILEQYNIKYDEFMDKINKMNDYISLEVRRIDFNEKYKREQEGNFIRQINDAIEEATQRAEDSIKKTESNLNTSVISVLGIFAAFIASYFGGLNTFSSIMSNLNGVTKFRIVFITLILGFILTNLTFLLLWFISRMLNKNMGSFISNDEIEKYTMLKNQKDSVDTIEDKCKEIANNKSVRIKKCYWYWKIKFKRFPGIFLFNLIITLGILITLVLKILDYNNIFKF